VPSSSAPNLAGDTPKDPVDADITEADDPEYVPTQSPENSDFEEEEDVVMTGDELSQLQREAQLPVLTDYPQYQSTHLTSQGDPAQN